MPCLMKTHTALQRANRRVGLPSKQHLESMGCCLLFGIPPPCSQICELVPSRVMATFSLVSGSVITSGTFTQVNNNIQARLSQTPWDRLQAAVAPAAFHNSAERFDSPRCHPNTRVAVMNELRDLALRRGDTGSARILWLSGTAGVGKSAIAQSFCDECFSINLLLASFFFNRSDPSRNTAKSFVATLTYQIYGRVPAYHQSLILGVIESDPMVFRRSVDAQFKALIIDPLLSLFTTNYFAESTPALIIVDGLDECSTAPEQVSILTALRKISNLQPSPFVFIVASRPEHDIQMFFRHSSLGSLLHRLTLNDSYRPDVDIELFLREKMQETRATHPLTNSISQEWPSSQAIRTLVRKSSGQFIYASVVIKYVTSNRHYPPDRLDVVLQLRPPKRDLPFAELDALYSHIFSCVKDITLVLRVLCIVLLFHERQVDILTKDVEELCELDRGECLSALCDLQSVLRVEPKIHSQQSIRLLHKSLPDYLQDLARSRGYYIDTTPLVVIPILTQCLRYISDLKLDYNIRYSSFILSHLDLLLGNIQLCHEDLMSFSLINCRTTYHGTEPAWDGSWLRENLLWFAFEFLNKLCTLEGTDYEHVYHHHLHQFPKLVEHFPEVYGPNSQENRDCIFPMIVIFILLGNSDTHISPKVFDLFHGRLSDVTLVQSPMSGLENLSCAAARRCINSLMYESSLKSSAFALECLPLILPDLRLSPDLNEACLLGAPFAFTMTQSQGLLRLARRAYVAMQEYRDRYGKAQPAVPDWHSGPLLLPDIYETEFSSYSARIYCPARSLRWLSNFFWPGDYNRDLAKAAYEVYLDSKDVASLNAAIKNFDLAAEQYRKHQNPSLPTTLINYAVAVWRHYEDCDRPPEDLEKVISLDTETRDSWSGEKNIKPYVILLNTLAGAYFEQYQRAFGPSPIKPDEKQEAFDKAVKHYIELKDNPAAENQRSATQIQLGFMSRTRCKREQTLDGFEFGVQHLQDALLEAIGAEKNIDAGAKGDKAKQRRKAAVDNVKVTCLLALAESYEVRYALVQKFQDLTMAMDYNTEAKPLLEELQHPELPTCLFNLARQHHLRWLRTMDPSDNDMAKEVAVAARDYVGDNHSLEQRISVLVYVLHNLDSQQGLLNSEDMHIEDT
ncbi:hypothetical protein D9619_008228 [Psilocybe cf. subviscida]|uniref:Nephrocystin 3-like N-terminal domain-containing protein n=1 Tax=Psilocybe cf. subviscida TaxID=2480587 RepID=A0A8H5ESB7_9AGAR|nr:hypothetical protein D9619_008228 [Psilocybe cf. subviscida]